MCAVPRGGQRCRPLRGATRQAADSAARAVCQAGAAWHLLAGVPLQQRRDLRAHLGVRGLHVRRPQDAAPRLRVGVRRRRMHAGAAPAPPGRSGGGPLPLGLRPICSACLAWRRAGAACARAGAARTIVLVSPSHVGSARLRPCARVRSLLSSAGEARGRVVQEHAVGTITAKAPPHTGGHVRERARAPSAGAGQVERDGGPRVPAAVRVPRRRRPLHAGRRVRGGHIRVQAGL